MTPKSTTNKMIMDIPESTKLVFRRIQKHDPENVSKITACLLFKELGELEMFRLAYGPDKAIKALIQQIKLELGMSPPNRVTNYTPFFPSHHLIPQIPNLPYPLMTYLYQNQPQPQPQPQLLPLVDQFGSLNLSPSYLPELPVYQVPDQRVPTYPELDGQICENFRKGYCKYGGDCKYLHVTEMENGYVMVLNEKACNHRRTLPHGPLMQLEMDIIELLNSRRGIPVTIYSLSILYFDKYGKELEIEVYVDEARKQGQVCSGIPEFLAQMSNYFRVIDMPYGMQSLILEEDIQGYLKFALEQSNDSTSMGSHHVYITFPPHSMFTDQDLHLYFNHFGPVHEIGVPLQQRRMFGFVTYVYAESAALVLTKTNPHYICGTQVLVKPYRHRQLVFPDRNVQELLQQCTYIDPYLLNNQLHLASSTNQPFMCAALHNNGLVETKEQNVDYKMKGVAITDIPSSSSSHNQIMPGSFNFVEGGLSGCSTSNTNLNFVENDDVDDESYDDLHLPNNPFSY